MAGEVGLQSDVYLTGRLPQYASPQDAAPSVANHRLQVVATIALIGMYLEVVSTHVVGSIDHTILFDSIELLISTNSRWATG